MSGRVALHGGGEYVAGDERAMDALVGAALPRDGRVLRVFIVPTAAARHRPELAAAHGRRAFLAAADRLGVEVDVDMAGVVDEATAADAGLADRLRGADLVHLPGGDPDLLPAILRGSAAWAAIRDAHGRGALVAGASAGAMALGQRLWTAAGPVEGLGLVPGVGVVPHFEARRAAAWRAAVDPDHRLAWLGLDERTLAIGRPGEPWRVAGAGNARLLGRAAGDAGEPVPDGGALELAVP